MELLTENRPETCSTLGLDCGACIKRCASTTAIICQDLQPSAVQRIFLQLYPSSGCQPMAHAFARAYEDAVTPSKPMVVSARVSAAAAA
jgi:hypothetical protein